MEPKYNFRIAYLFDGEVMASMTITPESMGWVPRVGETVSFEGDDDLYEVTAIHRHYVKSNADGTHCANAVEVQLEIA